MAVHSSQAANTEGQVLTAIVFLRIHKPRPLRAAGQPLEGVYRSRDMVGLILAVTGLASGPQIDGIISRARSIVVLR